METTFLADNTNVDQIFICLQKGESCSEIRSRSLLSASTVQSVGPIYASSFFSSLALVIQQPVSRVWRPGSRCGQSIPSTFQPPLQRFPDTARQAAVLVHFSLLMLLLLLLQPVTQRFQLSGAAQHGTAQHSTS